MISLIVFFWIFPTVKTSRNSITAICRTLGRFDFFLCAPVFSVNNSFWESAGAWLLFQLHAYPCSTFFSLEAFADPSTGSTIHIYYQFTQKVYLHQTKEHTLKFSKRSSVLQIAIIMLLLEERDPRGGSLWIPVADTLVGQP